MRLGLSHLNEHRFNHNFQGCINLLYSCCLEIKSTHIFSALPEFSGICLTVLNSISGVLDSITNLSICALVKIVWFGDQNYNYTQVEN